MNTLIDISNDEVRPSDLSDWLLARGIASVTTEDAARLMRVGEDDVRQRLAPLRKKGRFVSPARGLWVPVPPDRSLWGAPEPPAYLDDMMVHLGAEYYVGWLSAAALFGASHQAPQTMQIAVSKHISDRQVGRSRLHFMIRSRVGSVPVKRVVTGGGVVTASTVGATMLDLVEDIDEASGLGNAATAVIELAEENPGYLDDVLKAASLHSDAAVRRLGWILDELAKAGDLEPLQKAAVGVAKAPSLLSPYAKKGGTVNERWLLDINEEVELDIW